MRTLYAAISAVSFTLCASIALFQIDPSVPSCQKTRCLPQCGGIAFTSTHFQGSVPSVEYSLPRVCTLSRVLTSKSLYPHVRLVLDLKDFYLAGEYMGCSACGETFISWDDRMLQQLTTVSCQLSGRGFQLSSQGNMHATWL